MTSNAEIAKAMADNMTHAAVPLYGKKLRLPDRGAIIGIIKEFRRLLFPAYFGDAQLMALPPENYAALLLERIETALTAQVALALPEGQAFAAAALTHEILEQLPRIQQTLMTDIEATFDGDPAAADKEEIIFAYPGLFAIFVYRIAHELYLRQVPMIPRMMTEYAHSRTGIDIHPGAQTMKRSREWSFRKDCRRRLRAAVIMRRQFSRRRSAQEICGYRRTSH